MSEWTPPQTNECKALSLSVYLKIWEISGIVIVCSHAWQLCCDNLSRKFSPFFGWKSSKFPQLFVKFIQFELFAIIFCWAQIFFLPNFRTSCSPRSVWKFLFWASFVVLEHPWSSNITKTNRTFYCLDAFNDRLCRGCRKKFFYPIVSYSSSEFPLIDINQWIT